MKTTFASIALSLAMAGSAMAADLPSHRAPPVYIPPPVPVFTWTGFYVGGQVGYGFGNTRNTDFTDGFGPYDLGQNSSVIGGAHVGYNYQLGNALGAGMFGGGLVVGVEGDIEGSNNTSSAANASGEFDTHKGEIEGSVRGRLGIAVDRALFYATGGAAFAQFKDTSFFPGVANGTTNYSTSRVGWTVGGGVEYAITPSWSVRGEYRYTDFGSYFLPAAPFAGTDSLRRVAEQKVEFGVSYRFVDLLAPVVARY